ncbi:MAG: hypothetical protein ABJK28_02940 [Algibacter sp.]
MKTDNLNESVLEQDSIICIQQSEKGIKFETCLKKYDFFVLKSSNGNTLYRNDNNPSEFILKDFNEDGFSDIELHFITNVPDVNEILIFNPISKTFTEIENFWEFPAAKKIRKVNLYYSYQRSGCADSNWDSDLFYLKENKAVKIGNIQVIECNNESVNGIYFYIVNGNKKKLLKYISIEHKNFENKWEFIEKYWTKNYKKFE